MSAEISVVKAVTAKIPPARVREAIGAAAQLPEVAARLPHHYELAVRITGDRELHRLNRRFLQEDHPTDVLSFPSGDGGEGAHLGDIVVSWPAVRRQAAEHGHRDEDELALLVVHGFLHVLGWDHADPAEEAEMWALTRGALAGIGVELAPGRLSTS